MAPQDSVGRIHKAAFVGSTSALLGLTVIAVCLRLFYRLVRQKQFGVDDAVLVFGACTIIAAFVIVHVKVVDNMYLIVAMEARMPGVLPPGNPPGNMEDILKMAYDFHKWVTIALELSWFSIMAAKFSFLAFFWKLIDRIQAMRVYWWVVLVLNVGILGYGASVYFVSCPYFNDPRTLECSTGFGRQRLLTHSLTQMALDIFGDLLILYIPVTIVWKIRIRAGQKFALLLSLGLTVFMIILTIIRVSGIVYHSRVDSIWETYWLILGGEVGILMAAAIAFRAFFVARNHSKNATPPEDRRFFKSISRKFRNKDMSELESADDYKLGNIPGAQMTGVRTFINNQGKSQMTESQLSKGTWASSVSNEEDSIPLHSYPSSGK